MTEHSKAQDARTGLFARIGWMPVIVAGAGLAIFSLVALSLRVNDVPQPLALSAQLSSVLEVNPLMTLGSPAPDFSLTDQDGATRTLSSFAGRSLVLTFGDDKCTDLCTLLAEDVLAADVDLGSTSQDVEFVSINANPFYPAVADTKSWTDDHGLGATSNWHFLTGSPASLQAVAAAYGVYVELDDKTKSIEHGAEMFFISPTGNEEQIGEFGTQSANTDQFARAMAQLANELLPANRQGTVAGPSSAGVSTVATSVGSTPPPIELPRLGAGPPITTADYRGSFLVITFWSTTCTLCVKELPAMQQASEDLGSSAQIIGIDVSDPARAGAIFLARAGTTYPQLLDESGAVAGQYQLPGFPYTVILDPMGTVVVRHPGEMTTEQVEYIVQTLNAQNAQ
jgi:cytochrome oxidase Cu insertion factor (SCO1/SenC/PrrC family)/thiol-disulfide isomerase/thioredoxin